jgi:hypothetical protein
MYDVGCAEGRRFLVFHFSTISQKSEDASIFAPFYLLKLCVFVSSWFKQPYQQNHFLFSLTQILSVPAGRALFDGIHTK